ncbi:MAG: threonine aldolase [Candidatus Epulonipiscioides saccharophilum]|nr:MAG: threonine aldolase [Epulopiscium sp. AS2M-Bin001]
MFRNDYSEGAHPSILAKINSTNTLQSKGYGEDQYCESAKKLILDHIGVHTASVHFFVGGTQTNLTALSAFLRPHHGIVSPDTGHINLHETGAIEATGHAIIPVPNKNGKIYADQVRSILKNHMPVHMTKPKLIYISNSTEYGTIYSKKELYELRDVAKENDLFLYLDGARLGVALTCENNDLEITDICDCVDAFYFGGTKNGALFGEALVILNTSLQNDFKYFIKQRGALLAKGRLLGLQFQALFENNLFYDLASHANQAAKKLSSGIKDLGFNLLTETETNQIFVIVSNKQHEALLNKPEFDFEFWEPHPDGAVIRFVTSWATPDENISKLLFALNEIRD